MMIRKIFTCFLGSLLLHFSLKGQDTSIFSLPIQLDEYVMKASREGWDIAGFIQRVKEDTSFYKAFKTLRITPHTSDNEILIYQKKGKLKASYHSKTRQVVAKGCRHTEWIHEDVTGDFYKKNKDYRYYTASLYDYLFFSEEPICGETNIVSRNVVERPSGRIEKHKEQLKQLIFNPGSKVAGVPFAGNKAAIFEPDIAAMYDFRILRTELAGEECYLFSAIPKPAYQHKVIYNLLNTWFRATDYAILARDYELSYSTVLYDFNVKMHVSLTEHKGQLVPSLITYSGNWHVATQKREIADFTMKLYFE